MKNSHTESAAYPSWEEFQKLLTAQAIQSLQIMYIAFGGGMLILASLVFILYLLAAGTSPPEDLRFYLMLSVFHLLLFVTVYPTVSRFYHQPRAGSKLLQVLKRRILKPAEFSGLTAESFLTYLRTLRIIRIVMLESVAVVGLICCYLMAIARLPLYWLNLFSAFAFIVSLIRDFPTREKLENQFRENRTV